MTEKLCRIPIAGVEPDSIAQELGIAPGDFLLTINGLCPQDIIDFRFMEAEEELLLLIESGGELMKMEIEKDVGDDLGIIFDLAAFSPIKQCENHCIFCFVDQIPPGMRATLQIKDDDYRYSVIAGNFITLTNLSESDRLRIIEQHLSPLHISVHAMDPGMRTAMVGNAKAGKIQEYMEEFAAAHLTMHTQIVLCPDWNDGAVLDDTLKKLGNLYPAVASVGVVPVGLTGYRQGLADLKPMDSEQALAVIAQIDRWRTHFLSQLEYPLVYAADEFYALAGQPVPSREYYEDFPQTENGIGLLRLLLDQWEDEKAILPSHCPNLHVKVVSGTSSAPYLADLVADLNRISGLTVELMVVPNRFFGGQITVTGLITGQDLLDALQGRDLGDAVLLPDSMLSEEQERLLDDWTLQALSEALDTSLIPVNALGAGLAGVIQALCQDRKDE